MAGVPADREIRIDCVQVHVMEMHQRLGRLILRDRRRGEQRQQRQASMSRSGHGVYYILMTLRTLSLVWIAAFVAAAAEPDGAALYKQRCATCHEGKPQARMPSRTELGARTPEAVYSAMFGGSMAPQSA